MTFEKRPLRLTYKYLGFDLGFILGEGVSMSVTVGCSLPMSLQVELIPTRLSLGILTCLTMNCRIYAVCMLGGLSSLTDF